MAFQLPQETIFYLLEKSMKRYRKLAQMKIEEAGFEISVNQMILLMNLKERPQSSQVELAEILFKDFASVARMVEILVKNGYLKRSENPVDRRKKDLELSLKCRNMLNKLEPVMRQYRALALQKFSKEDITEINSFLKRLIDNCEKHI